MLLWHTIWHMANGMHFCCAANQLMPDVSQMSLQLQARRVCASSAGAAQHMAACRAGSDGRHHQRAIQSDLRGAWRTALHQVLARLAVQLTHCQPYSSICCLSSEWNGNWKPMPLTCSLAPTPADLRSWCRYGCFKCSCGSFCVAES